MPQRDPQTGQFVAGTDRYWDDIEVASFRAHVGVQAADLTGGTGFAGGDNIAYEGLEVLDYDDFVDRNEDLVLLSVDHRLTVMPNSTETADGTVVASMEISAGASTSQAGGVDASTDSFDEGDAVGGAQADDSIDLIGRPLLAGAGGNFSDGATGVGGAASAGWDHYHSEMFPAEFGRFHPRDELFANGRIRAWNIDDAGVHIWLNGQHVYGVLRD